MNLLTNPGFNDGHHHQDNIAEIVIPDGWYLHYLDNATFPGIGAGKVAYRPEAVTWNIKGAPEHEKPLFFLDGNYCLKVFKPWAPLYFALTQHVKGLTPGTRYRFTANVFPDIIEKYQGTKKVWPGDIWSAEARVGWSAPDTAWPAGKDGDVNWSDWFNKHSRNFDFGQYNEIWVEFTAPDTEVRVWLECKAKWGFFNNWFMDAFSLAAVGEEVVEPGGGGEEEKEPVKPPRGRGTPRVPYDRTYILLSPTISLDLAMVAMRSAYTRKCTVGFSADDAAVGDLDYRRIICVNPQDIGTGLDQVWYDENYPGVKFDSVEPTDPAELEAKLKNL
jgi:hypothetical protein